MNLPSRQLRRHNNFLYFFGVPGTYYHCIAVIEPNLVVLLQEEEDSKRLSRHFETGENEAVSLGIMGNFANIA